MTNPPELLTEADMAPLRGWCREPEASIADLRIVVERIVRARMAEAWFHGYDMGDLDANFGTRYERAKSPFADLDPWLDEEPSA